MKHHSKYIDPSSSFDKVLSRLEKITKRVNDAPTTTSAETRVDAAETRDEGHNMRDGSKAKEVRNVPPRNSRLTKSLPRTPPRRIVPKKTPKVKGTDFEVELVLSMSHQQLDKKKAANDIIWRAYATTKSFGAIIAGVVATQAVARRWLTLRRVRQGMVEKIGAVTKIKAAWRGCCCRRMFGKSVDDVIMCQSLVRRYLATRLAEKTRHEMETKMATIISANWRRLSSQKLYRKSLRDIIIVESLIRRYAAKTKASILRHERDTAAAVSIQTQYRSHRASRAYHSILLKTIAIQCFVRQRIALRILNELKEEKRIMEAHMTTRITAVWRRYHCQCVYRRTVRCVVVCQSIVRRFAAVKELDRLKFERDMAAATLIESEVRAYLAKRQYRQVQNSAVVLQSMVRQMIAYNELKELREERRELEEQEATRIAAVWRSYYVRVGYIIVLKAARKHEQRYNAASIVQAQWRAYATQNSFFKLKTNTIKIQSVVRMTLATQGLKNKKNKIAEAADYHKDDYFAYSKMRKTAAVKIQAVCRMHPVRKEYIKKKVERERLEASNKIQSAYRRRYSTRMSRATIKADLASSKPIFDTDCYDVEVKLGQYPTQHHVYDCFASAKKRQAASITIQTAFRGHLGRQSAKKTAYLAKKAFEISKQRRVAADKIRNAYRKHHFRTTCRFRSVPSCDEMCTEIVPYVAPTDGGFEIIVAGTDIFAMFMSQFAGVLGY